ncbi:MAG: WD40/YVTN/BNR-like repeat-containing protein [Pyrinomonadaceae bacterium]
MVISEEKERRISHGEFPKNWFSFLLINNQTWIITDFSNKSWRTSDAGKTWQKQFEAKSLIRLPSFLDFQTGYILVDSKLYRTIDSGNNWSELNDLTDTKATIIKFSNEHTAFLLAPDKRFNYEILKSEDGGIDWNLTANHVSNNETQYKWNLHDIQFWHNMGVAVGNGKCLISNDFGDSWKECGNIEGRFDRIDSSKKGLFLLVENIVSSSLVFDIHSKKISNIELPKNSQNSSYLYLSSWGEFYFLTPYGELFKSSNGQEWNSVKIKNAQWDLARQKQLDQNELPQVLLGETFYGELIAIMITNSGSSMIAIGSDDKAASWNVVSENSR